MRFARAVALALLSVSNSLAAQAVDVKQETVAGYGSLDGWSQTFKPNAALTSGAGFLLYTPQSTMIAAGSFAITLYSGVPGALSMLASANNTLISPSAGDFWLDAFWEPISTLPGSMYTLTLTPLTPPGLLGHRVNGFFDAYLDGSAFAVSETIPYSDGTFDLGFRTYTTTVSEPPALALTAFGLVLLGTRLRRRMA